jgi:hypothetical protein
LKLLSRTLLLRGKLLLGLKGASLILHGIGSS